MSGLFGMNAADHVEQEVKPELVYATGRLTQEESKVDVLVQSTRPSPVRSGHAQVTPLKLRRGIKKTLVLVN